MLQIETQPKPEHPVSRMDIIYLFQAYNRQELTLDELIKQTKAWAQAMQREYRQLQPKPVADL